MVSKLAEVIGPKAFIDIMVSNIAEVDTDDDGVRESSTVDVIESKTIVDVTVFGIDVDDCGIENTPLVDVVGSMIIVDIIA